MTAAGRSWGAIAIARVLRDRLGAPRDTSSAVTAPADDQDGLLPPVAERQRLLSQLKALIQARGAATFATALLLGPSPRFFPDPWRGGEASVRRLLRRLCGYAGLDLDVQVQVHDADPTRRGPVTGKPAPRGNVDLDAWLVTCDAKRLSVGVESSILEDPVGLVAALARVVAHAYRLRHGLAVQSGHDPQVDITAVYLGFGRLTADASLRFTAMRRGGVLQRARVAARLGSIPPQGLCYLLAAQVQVQGLSKAERQAIASGLQTNQAAFFRHSYAALERLDPPLAGQMGVPPREQWPPPPNLAALTKPFADDDDDAVAETRLDEDRGVTGLNVGKPVFMVDRSMAPRLGRVLFMSTVMLGGVASRMSPGDTGGDTGGIGMGTIAIAAVGLGLLGLAIGRLLRDRRCSEPKCGGPLTPDTRVCPRCSGDVVGTIHHPRERLAAEEAHAKATAGSTAGLGLGGPEVDEVVDEPTTRASQ